MGRRIRGAVPGEVLALAVGCLAVWLLSLAQAEIDMAQRLGLVWWPSLDGTPHAWMVPIHWDNHPPRTHHTTIVWPDGSTSSS